MKFVINKILLWLKDGSLREIKFEANKVNVITGDSSTGKSAIIDIIDYCFFSSNPKIPEEKINENVEWYGLNLDINDKNFTLARRKFSPNRKGSKEYFFSGIGEIPRNLSANISETDCKHIIEKEFSIDSKVVIPYGGKKIKAGNKISPRYFLLFNTQSEDVITHNDIFFDKQNDEKYREALERIFDLATGIETVENILIREKIEGVEKELNRLEKKKLHFENESDLYERNKLNLVKEAKKYNLIDDTSNDVNKDLVKLKKLVFDFQEDKISPNLTKLNDLKRQRNRIINKIRNYKKFKIQYNEYKRVEGNNLESLKPINYITEKFNEVIENTKIKQLLSNFQDELIKIKSNISNKNPFDLNIDDEIRNLEKVLDDIEYQMSLIPETKEDFSNEIHKYIFIGELKYKLKYFEENLTDENFDEQIKIKKSELEQLNNLLKDHIDRESVIKLLEELIQRYLDQASDALGTYAGYKAYFDYRSKTLKLRKPGSVAPSIVGSSSNHMFLHICFFLGLHELIMRLESPYVPQFLILDQPSRPYYGEDTRKSVAEQWEEVNSDDREKITIAMKILNDFILYVNKNLQKDFQIIVLEHIPESIWEEAKLETFHLVEEFKKGKNALINI